MNQKIYIVKATYLFYDRGHSTTTDKYLVFRTLNKANDFVSSNEFHRWEILDGELGPTV